MAPYKNSFRERISYTKSSMLMANNGYCMVANDSKYFKNNYFKYQVCDKSRTGTTFNLDTKGLHYPRYPIKDGTKF
jgi:hypothetical protein